MNGSQYKIQQIVYSNLSSGQFVFLVYANKCFDIGIPGFSVGQFAVHGINDDTEVFVYPQDRALIEPINSLCSSGEVWEPSFEEFEKSTLTTTDSKKRTAYFHFSLHSYRRPSIIISYYPESITYDRSKKHWLNLNHIYWEIDFDEIRTHCGNLTISGYSYVEDINLYGCSLSTSGYLQMTSFPKYVGSEKVFIKEVLILSRHQADDIKIWIYLIDANGKEIGIIEGFQRGLTAKDFQEYVAFIKNNE